MTSRHHRTPRRAQSGMAVMYEVEIPASAVVEVDEHGVVVEHGEVESTNLGESVEVMALGSPESNLKLQTTETQTTPSLLNNGPPQQVEDEKKAAHLDPDEDQTCPICFDLWTNSGAHRLSSLNCGHLFGRSCIERWLKEPKNKCCPQCKAKAKKHEIRNIFAKSLKALDTAERDQEKEKLNQEKYKRAIAEDGEAKAVLQVQLLRMEMERLKKQVEEAQAQGRSSTTTNTTKMTADRQPQACAAPSSSISTSQSSSAQSTSYPALTKSYKLKRSLAVAQKDARVMAYDKASMLLVVSKPSPNQLFPGYGIFKVSSLESRTSEFIRIHQNTIRDAKFNHSGDNLILTSSVDKTIKLTNVVNNSTVLSYTCPSPVWSCAWNQSDMNYIYAGLQNGSLYFFDIRKLDGELNSMRPRLGVPCPIVSLAYVTPGEEDSLLKSEGLLVGTLQGGWFVKKESDDTYTDHQLILPEGSCTGISFEPRTRHCLLSQRPGKKSARSCHTVLQLVGDCTPENPLHANVVQHCFGGNRALALAKSCLYTCPDDQSRLMVCSGDEASASVIVWDSSRGKEHQKLQCSGGTIFDVMAFEAYNAHYLTALTEQKLEFFQWQ